MIIFKISYPKHLYLLYTQPQSKFLLKYPQLQEIACNIFQNMIFTQNIEMIKDYIHQLKELQQDKAQFQSNAVRTKLKKTLNKQQDKYQAYIIDQMASQNRIIATINISMIVETPVRELKAQFLRNIIHLSQRKEEEPFCEKSISKQPNREDLQSQESVNSIPVDMVLLKMCTSIIFRQVEKIKIEVKRQAFTTFINFDNNNKILDKFVKVLTRYAFKHGINQLKIVPLNEPVEDRLFSDSFSMIEKQSRLKKCNPDESYLSFMIEKENAHVDCFKCKQDQKATTQRDKEVFKLKEELSYLKNLLTQKNIELKMKQEECDQLRLRSSDDSSYCSKNSSYYSQLQKQILGGKRARKTGSIASNTSNLPKEEISKELLGKYMRQSFQLKQTMDVAREICLQMQASIPVAHRAKLAQLLNVLNQGEEISLVDEY